MRVIGCLENLHWGEMVKLHLQSQHLHGLFKHFSLTVILQVNIFS